MIFKDNTSFTRKTWLLYHQDDKPNRLVSNFIEFVKTVDLGNV